ncbi:hypothetical protein CBL_11892 [Carabus blaptoides fortunei]
MFRFVVLSALIAVAVAAPQPGLLHAAPAAVAYSAPVVAHSAVVGSVPTAVSHQSRVDVHSKPVVATTYTAPAVHTVAAYHAAPAVHAVHAAPVFSAVHAAPAVVSAYAAPAVVSHGVIGHHGVVAAPLAYAHHY